jgi:DNA polymerase
MTLSKNERYQALKQIRDELLALTTSPLYGYRVANKYCPVIGEGDHQAKIMFVGEAPGETEAKTGRPFCGRAGAVLDELIKSIGLKRADVYITNLVKDRPPKNRDPFPEEIALYAPFLERQIEIIAPTLIATLGRYSMKYLLDRFERPEKLETISKLHGCTFPVQASYGPLTLATLYHPAVAVYSASMIDIMKEDFKKVLATVPAGAAEVKK